MKTLWTVWGGFSNYFSIRLAGQLWNKI
uniref:Uncharacterized protein n=1 Tax=Anguilla anguilla TaxID=7936 RepID=A0A0E9TR38_ANGAN